MNKLVILNNNNMDVAQEGLKMAPDTCSKHTEFSNTIARIEERLISQNEKLDKAVMFIDSHVKDSAHRIEQQTLNTGFRKSAMWSIGVLYVSVVGIIVKSLIQ